MANVMINKTIEIDGHTLTFLEFCEEPDTGLAQVAYKDYKFTVPVVWLQTIIDLRAEVEELTAATERAEVAERERDEWKRRAGERRDKAMKCAQDAKYAERQLAEARAALEPYAEDRCDLRVSAKDNCDLHEGRRQSPCRPCRARRALAAQEDV